MSDYVLDLSEIPYWDGHRVVAEWDSKDPYECQFAQLMFMMIQEEFAPVCKPDQMPELYMGRIYTDETDVYRTCFIMDINRTNCKYLPMHIENLSSKYMLSYKWVTSLGVILYTPKDDTWDECDVWEKGDMKTIWDKVTSMTEQTPSQ